MGSIPVFCVMPLMVAKSIQTERIQYFFTIDDPCFKKLIAVGGVLAPGIMSYHAAAPDPMPIGA